MSPEVLYVLGEGATGTDSALFFNPNENDGDFSLFDSLIFASKIEQNWTHTLSRGSYR